ncbi:hypothetical protein M569_00142, partial [Genlisea aurea]
FAFLILLNSSSSSSETVCELLVKKQGYTCEEHEAVTEDGYILSLSRIPTGRGGAGGAKPPVLLQHGLMADASTWLLNSPVESLGFILADNGFDVWMSNVRGTNFSKGHVSLKPDDQDYWNWSWDELVAYDLPAFFSYIHRETGQKLHYVGHSLGTLMALGAFSKGEVLSMVRSAVLLCPVAYLGSMPSPIARVASDIFMGEGLYWLGMKEFSPVGGLLNHLVNDICNVVNCDNIESSFTGSTNCCLNTSKPPITLLQSTATKNMVHLAQMIHNGEFAMFDYENIVDNVIHYGQPFPPRYEVSNIPEDLPILISYGGEDLLADVRDVQTLIGSLPNRKNKLALQYIPNYAHLDFVFAVNANVLVYKTVMDFFRKN